MQTSAQITGCHDVFAVIILLDMASRAFKLGILAHDEFSFAIRLKRRLVEWKMGKGILSF
jgi:hypothetical protein